MLVPKAVRASKLAEILDSSTQSVSSQMGCKEQSAFTKFARHERPKSKFNKNVLSLGAKTDIYFAFRFWLACELI